MNSDIIVGLLTLLGLVYIAWTQTDVRRAQATAADAEAIRHMTNSLIEAIETLAGRDKLIAELRARIETLEEHDRAKSARIATLERKIKGLEKERRELLRERDELSAKAGILEEG